jgi:hypothetical protein
MLIDGTTRATGTMNLDETQRKKVAEWIAQGFKLSDIQNRLGSEFGVHLTYMDVRLLVDDLKLTPKDSEAPKATPVPLQSAATPGGAPKAAPTRPAAPATAKSGGVSVNVDQIARPGAVVSGKVNFSDGNTADWYFDQAGRLGLVPQQAGYRPSAADLQQFQAALDGELSKMGF